MLMLLLLLQMALSWLSHLAARKSFCGLASALHVVAAAAVFEVLLSSPPPFCVSARTFQSFSLDDLISGQDQSVGSIKTSRECVREKGSQSGRLLLGEHFVNRIFLWLWV